MASSHIKNSAFLSIYHTRKPRFYDKSENGVKWSYLKNEKTLNDVVDIIILSEGLDITVLQLTSTNKSLGLFSVHALDGSAVLTGGSETLSQGSKLLSLDLAGDKVDVGQDRVNLGGRRLASIGKVVDILDRALENTLVLLGGVLSGFLGFLVLLTVSLSSLIGVLLPLLLRDTGVLLLISQALGLSLLFETLLVFTSTGLLAELLNTLILARAVVKNLTQTGGVFGLALAAGVGVLLLNMTLLVTVLVVIRHILIKVLERPPAVKVVPEVVEVLEFLLGGVVVTKHGDGLDLGETSLRLEHGAPEFEELALGNFLLRWGLNIGNFIYGIVLAATDGVLQQFGGDLDTLEEVVVLIAVTHGSLLVGVVTEDLLAVGTLDLIGG